MAGSLFVLLGMTVEKRVRIADSARLALPNETLFQISVAVIPATALGRSIGKLGRRRKAVLWSTVALVGIIAAVVPEAVDFDGINRATWGAAPIATGANVWTVIARPGHIASGICRIKPTIAGVEEGVVVPWAYC